MDVAISRLSLSVIVSTINVNGIRAAVKERSPENLGLLPWLDETRADVVCLQETRADDEQLAEALAPALADGWHLAVGRSTSQGPQRRCGAEPASVHRRSGSDFGAERIRRPRSLPRSRHRGPDRRRASTSRPVRPRPTASSRRNGSWPRSPRGWPSCGRRPRRRVCGDWNIAHTENDIKAWKANLKKAGFLPSERQWLDRSAGDRLGRRRAASCTPTCAGPVQLVVVARQGVRQRRRLAHRLPAGHRGSGRARRCRRARARRGVRPALVRPRAGDRRVRLIPGMAP